MEASSTGGPSRFNRCHPEAPDTSSPTNLMNFPNFTRHLQLTRAHPPHDLPGRKLPLWQVEVRSAVFNQKKDSEVGLTRVEEWSRTRSRVRSRIKSRIRRCVWLIWDVFLDTGRRAQPHGAGDAGGSATWQMLGWLMQERARKRRMISSCRVSSLRAILCLYCVIDNICISYWDGLWIFVCPVTHVFFFFFMMLLMLAMLHCNPCILKKMLATHAI